MNITAILFSGEMVTILDLEAVLDLRTWIKCKFVFILVELQNKYVVKIIKEKRQMTNAHNSTPF